MPSSRYAVGRDCTDGPAIQVVGTVWKHFSRNGWGLRGVICGSAGCGSASIATSSTPPTPAARCPPPGEGGCANRTARAGRDWRRSRLSTAEDEAFPTGTFTKNQVGEATRRGSRRATAVQLGQKSIAASVSVCGCTQSARGGVISTHLPFSGAPSGTNLRFAPTDARRGLTSPVAPQRQGAAAVRTTPSPSGPGSRSPPATRPR